MSGFKMLKIQWGPAEVYGQDKNQQKHSRNFWSYIDTTATIIERGTGEHAEPTEVWKLRNASETSGLTPNMG